MSTRQFEVMWYFIVRALGRLHTWLQHLAAEIIVEWLRLLHHILEVSSLNLGPETGYPE
jgi:hypothetical protein